jgi:hypothetical protein
MTFLSNKKRDMKKNNFNLLIIPLFLVSFSLFSQDLIIKKSGEEIKARVIEVGDIFIKYKSFNELDGPTREISKSLVFLIKYEDGSRDMIRSGDIRTTGTVGTDVQSNLAFTGKHRSVSLTYGISGILGLGGAFQSSGGGGISFREFIVGPLNIHFNKAISDQISLRFGPSFLYYHNEISSTYNYNYGTDLFFGGLTLGGYYHFETTQKIDPYVGASVGAGYFFLLSGDNNYDLTLSGTFPIVYGGNVGINLYGNKKHGAWNFELGYDYLAYLKVGYTFTRRR